MSKAPVVLVVMALLVIPTTGPVAAAGKTVVKLATLAPDGSIWHQTLKEMADSWAKVTGGAVTRGQFGLLGPGCTVSFENIGRAGIGTVVIVSGSPHNRIITGYGYRMAEIIHCRGITGPQFGLLGPGCTVPYEHIGRAGSSAVVIVPISSYHRIIAGYGHRIAELVR